MLYLKRVFFYLLLFPSVTQFLLALKSFFLVYRQLHAALLALLLNYIRVEVCRDENR